MVRVFALSLAVLLVLFIGQALNHSHLKGQNEASCQVCQAAHIGSGPRALTASQFSPLLAIGYVQPLVATIHQEFFFHDAPSRAPPSAYFRKTTAVSFVIALAPSPGRRNRHISRSSLEQKRTHIAQLTADPARAKQRRKHHSPESLWKNTRNWFSNERRVSASVESP